MFRPCLAVLCLVIACVGSVRAQDAAPAVEAGVPGIRHFPPQVLRAGPQILHAARDTAGTLYFAANRSIAIYDGGLWRHVRTGTPRRLLADAHGRVWVGCDGDLGYLEGAGDAVRFVSLREHLASADRPTGQVVATELLGDLESGGSVVFIYRHRVVWWSASGAISRAIDGPQVEAAAVVGGAVVLYRQQIGLTRAHPDGSQDTLAPPIAEAVQTMVAVGEHLLLGTADGALYRWDGSRLERFAAEATAALNGAPIYQVLERGNGGLVVASRGGGALELDATGRAVRHLDGDKGLPGDEVYTAVEDGQGALWLGILPGLVRVSSAPVSFYGDGGRGPKSMLSLVRADDHLYLGSMEGAYRMTPGEGLEPARFEPIEGLRTSAISWAATPQGLLVAGRAGIHRVEGLQARPLSDRGQALVWDPNTDVAIATADSLLRILVPDPGAAAGWRFVDHPGVLPERVFEIVPEGEGFWLITRGTRTLYRMTFPAGPQTPPRLEPFAMTAPWPRPLWVEGALRIVDRDRVLAWDPIEAAFAVDSRFDIGGWRPPGVDRYEIKSLGSGDLWVGRRDRLVRLEQGADDVFRPGALVHGLANQLTFDMLPDPRDPEVLWLATEVGPARVETQRLAQPEAIPSLRFLPPESSQITSVEGAEPGNSGAAGTPVVAHSDGALRFEVAVPYYEEPALNEFRYRLEGFGERWSEWTHEPAKEFTNVPGGDYRFVVEARHAGRALGSASMAFRVLPPWYHTWWARLGYVAVAALLLGLYVRVQNRRLANERSLVAREREVSRGLRELDQLKDEFLANTSHELRTPLYGITGLAESLLQGATGPLPEATRRNLEIIVASGHRLARLVNDLLDHSRLSRGGLELDTRPVDLHALTDIVLTLSRPLVGSKAVRLINAVSSDLPPALGDSDRLGQVLHNLVGNAVKFTQDGEVEVAAVLAPASGSGPSSKGGPWLHVTVRDTGIGIPESALESIFEPFEQVDSATDRSFGGTGLGLAVTRQLVELHGGRLWAESVLGEGSTLHMRLPVADVSTVAAASETGAWRPDGKRLATTGAGDGTQAEAQDWEPAGPAAPRLADTHGGSSGEPGTADDPSDAPAVDGGPTVGRRILVVDDEPVILQVLANQLRHAGYTVTLADTGEAALQRLESETFDLLLLDVMMPRMSGYEVCRALRRRLGREQMPVVFLTAKNQIADLVAGLSAGGNDYLVKPVSQDELLARIGTHLGLLELHRDLEDRNRELARLNHTISHDFSNELTTISNFIGKAQKDFASGRSERVSRDLKVLARASAKLRQLIDDLLVLTGVGIRVNPPEEVAVEALVEEALASFAGALERGGVRVDVGAGLPTVYGDRERMTEILRQLVQNALEYADASTPLELAIGARSSGKETVVFVRDNGIGIDPRYHERIFELFERLEPEVSDGTGIGLPLVQRIVDFHGGRVWVESAGEGHGSTFYFTLPRVDEVA